MTIDERMRHERLMWELFLEMGGDPVVATTMHAEEE
jgi:hypothetical protein